MQKGLLQRFIAGEVGQHAQLYLAVICIQQHAAPRGYEILAEPAAQLSAHRNVLQIGLVGRDAACARLCLVEGGMNASVRAYYLQKPLHIGGVQFLISAVQQDMVDDRAVLPQALQRFGVGRITAFCLFARGQAKVLKQGLPKLFWTVHVELVAYGAIYGGQLCVQRGAQLFAEGLDAGPVHQNAAVFHIRQHPGQRQFDVVQKALKPFLFTGLRQPVK